jgi:tetratricopeptide (TPR) repeat protein
MARQYAAFERRLYSLCSAPSTSGKSNVVCHFARGNMPKNMLLILILFLPLCKSSSPKIDTSKSVIEWHWSIQPMYGDKGKNPKLTEKLETELAAAGVPEKLSKKDLRERTIMEAWELFYKNKYEEAMRLFNLAWWLDNDDHRPYWGMGNILEKFERYQDAEPLFQKAFSLRPSDSELYYTRAITFLQRKRSSDYPRYLVDAEAMCKRSLDMNNQDDRAYFTLALIYFRQGRFHEAKDALDKADTVTKPHFGIEADKKSLRANIEKKLRGDNGI